MGGGLIQLVSLGSQDEYLIGNPQITFFKTVYRRHTNFAIETIEQTINGKKDTDKTETVGVVNVSRVGDLLINTYITCDQTINRIKGNKLIKEVELILGGTLLDKHTSEWMEIYSELYTPESKSLGYKYMTGGFDNNIPETNDINQQKIMIPLRFFYCNNHAQALPIIALQFHDITLKFKWGDNNIINSNGNQDNSVSCEVWCDYIFLDQEERKRFSEKSHEYLIEQLQYKEYITPSRKFDLNFNHPVKSLFWTTSRGLITTQKATIHLNGTNRFYKQPKEYFQLKQPYEHFTSIPGYNINGNDTINFIKPISIKYNDDDSNNITWPVTTNDPPSQGGSVYINNNDEYMNLKFRIASEHEYLDLKVGDIILISISVINNLDSGAMDPGVFTQNSITFLSQINTIEYNSTLVTLKLSLKNYNININQMDIYNLSMNVIARYHNNVHSRCSNLKKNINCYSFALNPEDHQPSGTCNFSKIDDIKLVFDDIINCRDSYLEGPLTVYALNYNVLRIKNGMGGLAYSN